MDRAKERKEALAVHRAKLEEFLRALGLLDPLAHGELTCHFCDSRLSLGDIGLILPSGGEVILCCSTPECIAEAHELQRGAN